MGRVPTSDKKWFEGFAQEIAARNNSEVLRRVIAFARQHEKELLSTTA
jgi:hypothetical protein